MKKSEVKIGGTYKAKVTNKLVDVRIDGENRHGGWDGTNLATGKKVRIKSAQRLGAATTGQDLAEEARGKIAGKKAAGTAKCPRCKGKKKIGKGMTCPTCSGTGTLRAPKPKDTRKAGKATGAPKGAKKGGKKAEGKMSGLDAAAKVLGETGKPMNCKEMVEQMLSKGYWTTGGKTPAATIYSAILRHIAKNGKDARFVKAERGKFGLAG